ncbi:MAG: hypothetical protein ABI605_04885 [Rhizobacter sp.]
MTKPQYEDSLTVRLATQHDAQALKRHRITCGLTDVNFSPREQMVILATQGEAGGVIASMTVGLVNSKEDLNGFFGRQTVNPAEYPIVVTKDVCALGSGAMNALRLETVRAAGRLVAAESISLEASIIHARDLVGFGFGVNALDVDRNLFSEIWVTVRLSRRRFLQSMTSLTANAAPFVWRGPPLFSEWLASQ